MQTVGILSYCSAEMLQVIQPNSAKVYTTMLFPNNINKKTTI